VLQLTHHYNNLYAGGALSLDQRGLSKLGVDLIDKLESKHMLIDLSHASVESAQDTLARANGPIVQTHGAARAIINNARCTPDHILKGIADSGGVFGVFMMSWWLTNEQVPRPEHYVEHLKHVRNVAGIDTVAIANDYPLRGHEIALSSGNNNAIAIKGYDSWWQGLGKKGVLGFEQDVNHIVIPELNHVKRMRSIEYQLAKANFSSTDIDKIMGENWQRVLVDVLG
jgi:membrane dipeptidase